MPSERYCRQINLIGEANQLKLTKASVIVIGAGGIGSPLLLYLTAGGVGTVGFIDHDDVALSNLHRQIIFTEKDIGKSKSAIAYDKLKSLNSEIQLNEHNSKLTIENAHCILSHYDLVIDGSDNFKTRYLVNDICCQLNKPFISSSIFQNKIQIILFNIKQGCYRCLFPEPPPPFLMNNCSEAGVLGAATGIAGSMTASLAIQYLINPSIIDAQTIINFDNNKLMTEHLSFSQKERCTACYQKKLTWPTEQFSLELKHIDLTDYTLIDIREHDEERNIKFTNHDLHIPFTELINQNHNLPQGKLLLYCKSGLRSDYAAYFLRKNRFNAFSLDQGVSTLGVTT